jgi:hypothetical protein
MRRVAQFLLVIFVAILIMALGGGRDEADSLSMQLSDAAQQLSLSNDDEAIIWYEPHSGIQQQYWVAIGAGPRCPKRPCVATEKSFLTVHTEGRDSGISYSYQRYVTVPQPLKVTKNGERVEIVLRKIGDEIEVVAMR